MSPIQNHSEDIITENEDSTASLQMDSGTGSNSNGMRIAQMPHISHWLKPINYFLYSHDTTLLKPETFKY
jgi:hypothetical protein